jgi:hypothetical protein
MQCGNHRFKAVQEIVLTKRFHIGQIVVHNLIIKIQHYRQVYILGESASTELTESVLCTDASDVMMTEKMVFERYSSKLYIV